MLQIYNYSLYGYRFGFQIISQDFYSPLLVSETGSKLQNLFGMVSPIVKATAFFIVYGG